MRTAATSYIRLGWTGSTTAVTIRRVEGSEAFGSRGIWSGHGVGEAVRARRSGVVGISATDAFVDGVAGEASDVVDVKLVHELLAVPLDRFDAELEIVGDLFVGPALGNEAQHLIFAQGEAGG